MKRYNLESIVQKANEVHNNKYDYSLITEYIGVKASYYIKCSIHGAFKQSMDHHINRKDNCPKCTLALNIRGINKTKGFNSRFISSSQSKFGISTFDYSLLPKTYRAKDIVQLRCIKHNHIFNISTNKHLSYLYGGCDICAGIGSHYLKLNEKHKNEFIEAATSKYGYYDYSNIDYVDNSTNIDIVCPKHGVFIATPSSHIHKNVECKACKKELGKYNYTWHIANLNKRLIKLNKPLFIYLIKMSSDEEQFLKIGISCNSQRRFLEYRRFGFSIEILYNHLFENCLDALDLEKHILDNFKSYNSVKKFAGCTECFGIDLQEQILEVTRKY